MASGEDLPLPLKLSGGWADGAAPSLTVAPPRARNGRASKGAAPTLPHAGGAGAAAARQQQLARQDGGNAGGAGGLATRQQAGGGMQAAGASRTLRAELSMAKAELQARSSELTQSKASLRCVPVLSMRSWSKHDTPCWGQDDGTRACCSPLVCNFICM